MNKLFLLTNIFLILQTCQCGVISKNLFGEKISIDQLGYIIGIWKAENCEDKNQYIIVQQFDKDIIHIQIIEKNFKYSNEYTLAYITKNNDKYYANIKSYKNNKQYPDVNGFIILNFKIVKNNRLTIIPLNMDFFKNAINSNKIKGDVIYTKDERRETLGVIIADSKEKIERLLNSTNENEYLSVKESSNYYRID